MPKPWSSCISISKKSRPTSRNFSWPKAVYFIPFASVFSCQVSSMLLDLSLRIDLDFKLCVADTAPFISGLEHRYPGGEKVTFYRKAKLERFGLYLQSDGLITRLTTYKDLSCVCPRVQGNHVHGPFPRFTTFDCVLKAPRRSWWRSGIKAELTFWTTENLTRSSM